MLEKHREWIRAVTSKSSERQNRTATASGEYEPTAAAPLSKRYQSPNSLAGNDVNHLERLTPRHRQLVRKELRSKSMFRGTRNGRDSSPEMAKLGMTSTFYLQGFDYKKPTKDSVQYPRLNDRAQTSSRFVSRDNKAVFRSEEFHALANASKLGGPEPRSSLPMVTGKQKAVIHQKTRS